MRPTPAEFAAGIRALLRDISPEVTSVQGVRNLRRAMATLRDVGWNEAGFDMLAENAVLAEALGLLRGNAGLGDAAQDVDAAWADQAAPASFEAANKRNLLLRGLLSEALDAVAAHDRAGSAPVRTAITQLLLDARTRS